jgi:hypothetical protein
MKIRIAATALLAPLLAAALIAPRPLSIALGMQFAAVRSAVAAHVLVIPSAGPAPVVLPGEQLSDTDGEVDLSDHQAPASRFAGPGPGWG